MLPNPHYSKHYMLEKGAATDMYLTCTMYPCGLPHACTLWRGMVNWLHVLTTTIGSCDYDSK